MSGRVTLPAICLALALTAVSTDARASDAAAAQALFEEGRALMAKGDYVTACTKLEGSQALDPGPGTQYNLALCYEKGGRTASAWATYLEAATGYEATGRPDWEAKAHGRANALVSTLARITITRVAAPGASITRDGNAVVESELGTPIPVDPGTHTIEAKVDGRTRFHAEVDAVRATTRQIEVVLAPAPAAAAASPASPAVGATPRPDRRIAYTVGGVGIAGLAFGAVAGLVAIARNSSSTKVCADDGLCADAAARRDSREAHDWATVSTVGVVAGAALVATGALLYVIAPSRKAPRGALHLTPLVGLGSAALVGTW